MMGTNQRDLFIPILKKNMINTVQEGGSIFDFGGGDGQTFNLLASSVPNDTTISVVEINQKYINQYKQIIKRHEHLNTGVAIASGFDEMSTVAQDKKIILPVKESFCLALAIHMIYFLPDLLTSIKEMYSYLRVDGLCLLHLQIKVKLTLGMWPEPIMRYVIKNMKKEV